MFRFLDLLEQLDLLIGLERDDGLLPVAALADETSGAPDLAPELLGPDLIHLDREHQLDRALDLDLVRRARHFEDVLVAQLAQHRAFLGDQRPPHDAARIVHRTNTSLTRSSPGAVNSTASAASRSCALSWCASVVFSFLMLRQDFHTRSSA